MFPQSSYTGARTIITLVNGGYLGIGMKEVMIESPCKNADLRGDVQLPNQPLIKSIRAIANPLEDKPRVS